MDWKKLYDDVDQWAAAHRQEFIDDISEVCRIRSVSIMNKQDPEKPFGAACRQMLDKALEMSGRYGFETRNYDNFCGSAVYGSNPDNDSIGIFSHMDIVPEGEGWTHDPFDPILSEDGKYLFARGTADNKSCGIMAMYAMRYLKEHDIKLKNNVMLVFGLNEEIGMNDIPEFLAREKCPKFSLVPDAKYPITYAEKGITKSVLKSPKMTGNLKDMWSGLAVNAGSPIAWAVLEGVSLAEAEKALEKFEKTTVEAVDGGVKITVEKDENKVIRDPIGTWTATARLCKVLAGSGLLTGNGQEVLNWMAEISDDYRGEKMGIACNDEPNGPLRCSFNMIRMEEGRICFYPDIRYPSLADQDKVLSGIKAAWAASPMELESFSNLDPFYISLDNPFAQKLIEVARDALEQPDIEPLKDGGTYARRLPNAIPYGATVPGRVRLFGFAKGGAHQADEYCDIPNLLLNMRVYVRALIELDQML